MLPPDFDTHMPLHKGKKKLGQEEELCWFPIHAKTKKLQSQTGIFSLPSILSSNKGSNCTGTTVLAVLLSVETPQFSKIWLMASNTLPSIHSIEAFGLCYVKQGKDQVQEQKQSPCRTLKWKQTRILRKKKPTLQDISATSKARTA